MFEHANVWISHSNIGIQTSAPMFEYLSAGIGCQGKSFSGFRGANELVRVSDPTKLGAIKSRTDSLNNFAKLSQNNNFSSINFIEI